MAIRRAAGRRSARAARRGPGRARRHPRRHGHRDPDAHGRAPLGRRRPSTTRAGTPATSKASSTSSSTTWRSCTGRHFIHGQPVGLGIVLGSVLQDNGADEMVAAPAARRRRHPAGGDGRHVGRRRGRDAHARDVRPRGRPVALGRRRAGRGRQHRRRGARTAARAPTAPGRMRREGRHHPAAGLRPRVPRPRWADGLGDGRSMRLARPRPWASSHSGCTTTSRSTRR